MGNEDDDGGGAGEVVSAKLVACPVCGSISQVHETTAFIGTKTLTCEDCKHCFTFILPAEEPSDLVWGDAEVVWPGRE